MSLTERICRIWLAVSTAAVAGGWLLSLAGRLDETGYLVLFVAGAVPFGLAVRRIPGRSWRKAGRRFQSDPGARVFLFLALLVLAGGILYAPSNYDGLAYRVPRVLSWLDDGRWSWLQTANQRMNFQAAGWEWMAAPLLLFTHSDRLLFLINFVPFLLLPGLVFRVGVLTGLPGRLARRWMWILPLGAGFLLQAGSIGSDLLGAFYFMLAVMWALSCRRTRRLDEAVCSILAIALMTGVKATNLPLVLPWLAVFAPSAGVWLRRPVMLAPVLILAAAVSWIPVAWENHQHCGDWFGVSLMSSGTVRKVEVPWVGLVGNGLLLGLQNGAPPVLPGSSGLEKLVQGVLPEGLKAVLARNFENDFDLGLGELQIEEAAGLGLAVSLLLAAAVLGGLFFPAWRRRPVPTGPSWLLVAAGGAMAVAIVAFMTKSGMTTAARLFLPYYLFTSILVLRWIGRAEWSAAGWRRAYGVILVLSVPLVVFTPARPLWPALTVLHRAAAAFPGKAALVRAERVYEVYRGRPWVLSSLGKGLIREGAVVGLVGTGDDASTSLWKPYFSRRVVEYNIVQLPEALEPGRLNYVVVSSANLSLHDGQAERELAGAGARRLASGRVTFKVQAGEETWILFETPGVADPAEEKKQ
jgi:hypothetical protein